MLMQTALLSLIFAFGAAPHLSEPVPRSIPCPADPELANLLAGSNLVLIGRMTAPAQLAGEAEKPSPGYLDIPVVVDGVLKGDAADHVSLRFYPKDAPYKPSNDDVLRLTGVPAILFLTRAEDGLYFAGYTPGALTRATDLAVGTTRAEISRQEQIAGAWRIDTRLPRFGEVRTLIARLGHVRDDAQRSIFEQLEALGSEAVPAIIAQMDDRRPLLTQEISLINHDPDAFEGITHYGPEQVVDALNAVLTHITGVSFGSISNGGSDRERDAAIAGWRVYANDIACKQADRARGKVTLRPTGNPAFPTRCLTRADRAQR
ncbi:hypothetical protein P1X14_03935 [Sphingomonas sp. AOB5]|uniref:hypothetical protein n=1 Tax=Sphingomonas sp. AOB5 TaxID=3034017 RepID=UPI0023F9C32F|nr:hypothetical protein [Sphingomonas sp. AOB5]MDF7774386.1 hypothetical protein [Sphingomonas sp. AOB5]